MSPQVGWKTDDAIVARRSSPCSGGRCSRRGADDGCQTTCGRRWRRAGRISWTTLRPLFPMLLEKEPGWKRQKEYVSGTYRERAAAGAYRGLTLEGGDDLSRLDGLHREHFFPQAGPGELLIKETPDRLSANASSPLTGRRRRPCRNAVLAFSAFKTLPYREFLGDFTAAWHEGKKTLFVEEFSQTLAGLFDRLARGSVPLSLPENVGPLQQLPFRRVPGHLDPAVQGPGPAHRRGAVAGKEAHRFSSSATASRPSTAGAAATASSWTKAGSGRRSRPSPT